MSEDKLGTGIALDTENDVVISKDGDLKTIGGFAELEKDVAYRMQQELEGEIGKVIGPNSLKSAEISARRAALADDRIEEVLSVTASEAESEKDEIEIEMELLTSTDVTYSTVFLL